MTPEELEQEADAIAARRADPRTAAVVRRAFLQPGAMTLRKYLLLEEENSPILHGTWPWEDAAAMAQAFCRGHEILFPEHEVPGPDQLQDGLMLFQQEAERVVACFMPMRSPRMEGIPSRQTHDGIGWVPRLLASAIKNGIPAPLDLPLDQLHILTAAMAANEGMECAGEDYRDRLTTTLSISQQKSVNQGEQVHQQSADDRGAEENHSTGEKKADPDPVIEHLEEARENKVQRRGTESTGANAHDLMIS